MTKRELCKRNKQMAEERLHATAEWQESERLIEEMESLYQAGRRKEASKLYWKIKKLQQIARSKN